MPRANNIGRRYGAEVIHAILPHDLQQKGTFFIRNLNRSVGIAVTRSVAKPASLSRCCAPLLTRDRPTKEDGERLHR